MGKEPEGKHVRVGIKTTEEHLDSLGIGIADIEKAVTSLIAIFGRKYGRFFPLQMNSTDIDRVIYVANILNKISHLPGFKNHIRTYDKGSIEHHLFTAKTAEWLVDKGKSVEFEPLGDEPTGKSPDLLCRNGDGAPVYLECKRIETDKFYDLADKQMLADLIYDKLGTCDQLDFYLPDERAADKVVGRLDDKEFASAIFKAGMQHKETQLDFDGEFQVGVIQKPAIGGDENDFLTVTLFLALEDVRTGIRLPGFVFMRGGRSIGVHGPPPDYRSIFNRKRSKSKRQSIDGCPYVAIICGDDLLGNPQDHLQYFERDWLTKSNSEFSGIGVLSFARMIDDSKNPIFKFTTNLEAAHPIASDFFA